MSQSALIGCNVSVIYLLDSINLNTNKYTNLWLLHTYKGKSNRNIATENEPKGLEVAKEEQIAHMPYGQ